MNIHTKITEIFATAQYQNEYGIMVDIPAPHIYLGAAIVGALIIFPLFFLTKEFKKESTANK